jgi:glycosyltransferase involved in cell wall biosynthesis
MKLSIVIPSRNRVENLRGTLAALAAQSLNKDEFEVILVDDNSTDGTSTLIPEYRDQFKFKYIFSNVPKPHSWNASVIRNLGALAADPSTMAYVFVDSDVKLPPDALKCYLEDLEMNKNRVIIGPYDFYKQGNEQIGVADVRNLKFTETTIDQTFDTIHDGLACFGGNLVIPKDIFWSVGGFSPDIHIGLEDGDMGIKLWKKHTQFSYDSRTRGVHQWHQTPEDRFPGNMKAYIDNLNQKHFHMNTSEVDTSMDIISASRDTYASWGITGWNPPEEWLKEQIA